MTRTAILLLVCFMLAQADKQVIGLIAVPLQKQFALSNTQLGFLQGGAFAIAFALGGLPIARLIDGGHRVRIAAACVTVWSIATIICGLAGSFVVLAIFRAATAVAEAGLPPAAFSIFSQSGDRKLAARLTGMFMLAPFIGGGLVLILGGALLGAISSGSIVVPAIAEPWRAVLLAVALPGLLLGPLLALAGVEPHRERTSAISAGALPSYRDVLAHVFVRRPFLRFYYLGLTFLYLFVAALIAWFPALLIRSFGLTLPEAGGYAGVTYLIGGVLGTVAATAWFSTRSDLSAPGMVRDFFVATLLLGPVAALLPVTGSLRASLALYGVYAFLSAGVLATLPIPMQLSLDDRIKARGVALASLLMSALAGTAGPLLVGVLVDRSGLSLAGALSVTAALSAVFAALFLYLAWRAGRAEIDPK